MFICPRAGYFYETHLATFSTVLTGFIILGKHYKTLESLKKKKLKKADARCVLTALMSLQKLMYTNTYVCICTRVL